MIHLDNSWLLASEIDVLDCSLKLVHELIHGSLLSRKMEYGPMIKIRLIKHLSLSVSLEVCSSSVQSNLLDFAHEKIASHHPCSINCEWSISNLNAPLLEDLVVFALLHLLEQIGIDLLPLASILIGLLCNGPHGVEVLAHVIIKTSGEGKLWQHEDMSSHLACGLYFKQRLVHVLHIETVSCFEVLSVCDLTVLASNLERICWSELCSDVLDCIETVASMFRQNCLTQDLLLQVINS